MFSRLIAKSSFLCLALVVSAFGGVQDKPGKPDFNGTWMLDLKKSNSSGLTGRPDVPIKIVHNDPEFRVTLTTEVQGQLTEREFVYFTDGRGETNDATNLLTTNPGAAKPSSLGVTESRTKWSGIKIVTRSDLRATTRANVLEFELVDEWKLTADGKSLTHTTATVFKRSSSGVFIPAMAPDKKRVYNRLN